MRADTVSMRSRQRIADVVRTGTLGLHTRRGRTALTATGIAIGIASMFAILGISSSSRADLLKELDSIGANLLEVRPGNSVFGDKAVLSTEAAPAISRIPTVQDTGSVNQVKAGVSRNPYDDSPNQLAVIASDGHALRMLGAQTSAGRVVDAALSTLPVVTLGHVAASRLAVTSLKDGPVVTIGGHEFQVIGILKPMPLRPDLERAVFIGQLAAERLLGAKANPTSIYVRVHPDRVDQTRPILARTADPAHPTDVDVSRPSDALEARASVDTNLRNLLLALGGVALLVGGVGIANVMVISVLERRGEVGLRRALGATRPHIVAQFVVESAALALLGGLAGVGLGAAVTWVYATRQGWTVDIPVPGLAAGVAASLLIGAIAGVYPATRAARLDPAEAVRPTS